jgi:hypothetical protein
VIPPDELVDMLTARAGDPDRAVVEVLLLRTGLDRLDDHLIWLEAHCRAEHPGDAVGEAIAEVCDRAHRTIASILEHADYVLAGLDDE